MSRSELEQEVESLARGRPHRDRLKELMNKKELVSGEQGPMGGLVCDKALVRE